MNAIRQCLSQLVQPARFCLAPPTKLRAASRVPLLQHSCPAAQHQLTARALHLSREAGRGHRRLIIFQTSCGSGSGLDPYSMGSLDPDPGGHK